VVSKNPSERILIARIAAAVRWSREKDRKQATAAARRASLARWEREVDPEGTMEPEERARLAEHAQRAHMLRMSRAAATARRAKSGGDK